MIVKCQACGKSFDVLWPQLYRYRRDSGYLCSWGCVRQYDRKEENEMSKISKEQKKKAVEIALEGGDPRPYLRECGSKNPDNLWYWMKNQMKVKEPEMYEKLARGGKPAPINGWDWEKMEIPETIKVPSGMKTIVDDDVEAKLPEKPEMVTFVDGGLFPKVDKFEYKVTGIETQIGDFQYFRKSGYLDWTPLDGNGTVSMTVEEWKELLKLLPMIAERLEVEL